VHNPKTAHWELDLTADHPGNLKARGRCSGRGNQGFTAGSGLAESPYTAGPTH
jgi:hypothetical protein